MSSRTGLILSIGALVATALAAACGPIGSTVQPVPTATAQPTTAPATATPSIVASLTPTDTPAPTPTLDGSKRLLILHTNDVAGYTDPCG